jgi:type IV pilus assembly protein PilW
VSTAASSRQQGITLVELMVALVIGTVLMAGVTQIFLGSRESYRLNEGVARLQENGRFALEVIARDLRMAGTPSCLLRDGIVFNQLQGEASVPILERNAPVDGWEAIGTAPGNTRTLTFTAAEQPVPGAGWATSAVTALAGVSSVPGSDVIRLRRMEATPPTIDDISPGANTVVTLTETTAIVIGDIFVMCNNNTGQGHIVQACNVHNTGGRGTLETENNSMLSAGCVPGNKTPVELGMNWGNSGVVSVPREIVYFVARRNAAAPPALFRRIDTASTTGAREELAEGVESLQILYGIDTSGNLQANEYRTADQVSSWDRVVSARIGLILVSTEDNLAPPGQNDILLFDTTFEPPANDRRLRQTMTATVTLRNRVP